MDSTQTSVVVALIPQDDSWCKIEEAHMTLVYVGETTNLKQFQYQELAKDLSSISMMTSLIHAKVYGQDVFGEEERVDVLLITPTPEILALRRMLEKWDDGEFPSFEPHVTVGPEGTINQMQQGGEYGQSNWVMPMYLCFDRIMLMWGGEERLTFWLKKY